MRIDFLYGLSNHLGRCCNEEEIFILGSLPERKGGDDFFRERYAGQIEVILFLCGYGADELLFISPQCNGKPLPGKKVCQSSPPASCSDNTDLHLNASLLSTLAGIRINESPGNWPLYISAFSG